MNARARGVVAGAVAFALATVGVAHAQSLKISGEVVRLDASTLQVRAGDGQVVAVRVGDNVRLSARSPADIDRILPGVFLGTTAVPRPDGTLSAVEVHIFPESMRGTGEGHRPMDTAPGSTMTNATVSRVSAATAGPGVGNTMTSATVAAVGRGEAEWRMTLTYNGGEKVVIVPADTPIVMVEPGDRAMLAAGARVVVYATRQTDGTLSADRITIGKNGFVPPT